MVPPLMESRMSGTIRIAIYCIEEEDMLAQSMLKIGMLILNFVREE